MILRIWLGDEGPTDQDLKDGDIWGIQDDAWVPGLKETQKWLNIKLPEYGGDQSQLVEAEYAVGTPAPVILHARKYYVKYWELLDPDDLAIVRDKTQAFPIVDGSPFGLFDITRK